MPDTIITPAPDIAILAQVLMRADYPELLEASILYLATSAMPPCHPYKLDPLRRYLGSLHLEGAPRASVDEGPDLILLVNAEEWAYLREDQRRAYLAHRLLHIDRRAKEDGSVVWGLKPHDTEAFDLEVQQYGLHSDALQRLGQIIQPELDLALPSPEVNV
jgi:hypothetical protein